MKKLFILSVLLIAAYFTANAQNSRFGFTAGTSFANYNVKDDGTTDNGSLSSITGITAGVFVDVPVSKHFSFQPAVNFVTKGTKDAGSTELDVNCMEVPLNFLYNSGGNNGNFFIGAGPSFTFSLSGSVLFLDEPTGGGFRAEDLKFGNSEESDMKGFDFGANFMTGYCFKKGFLVSANYNAGLTNLVPGGSDNGTIKSDYFGIKLGYLLKAKAKK